MKKIVALVLCAAMLAVTAVGCAPAASSGNKMISVCIASEPATMDPALNQSSDGGSLLYHLFEGIYKLNDKSEPVYGQAKDVKMSEDGLTWTITLRDDVKWSDGTPVTADDFVYAWQRVADPNNAAPYSNLIFPFANGKAIATGEEEDITKLGAKALDPKTIEIKLDYPCPYFQAVLAFPVLLPVNKAVVSKAVADGKEWTQDVATYVSNGPMVMTAWNHKENIQMKKNDNYYDKAKITDNPLKWMLMDDNNAMLAAYENGEMDYLYGLPVDEMATLQKRPDYHVLENFGTYYVDFNCQKAPFNDPRVRKALSLVIDRNYITGTIKQDGSRPTSIFTPPNLSGPTPGSKFNDGMQEYVSVDPADYDKNVAEAQKLLADAGFPEGKGFPTFEYMTNKDSGHVAIFEYMQNVWKEKLGISCSMTANEWAVCLEMRNQGNYESCRDGWLGDYNDPSTFLEIFQTGNGNNNAQYSNPAYDKLFDEANQTVDVAKRFEMMHAVQDLLMEEAGITPLYNYVDPILVKETLTGYTNSFMGYKFFMSAKTTAK